MLSKLIILSACLFSLTLASTPKPICTPTLCLSGSTCIETKDGAKCVPKFTPNAGCAVIECAAGNTCLETPKGGVCIPSGPVICIQIFQPVCCRFKDGEVKTAGNSCGCDGHILAEGECKPKPCICTLESNAVCCKTDKGFKIESNPCFCTKCKTGAKVVPKRKCSKCSKCDGKREQVCCNIENRVRTVRNKCRCECRGGAVVKPHKGKCNGKSI